MPVYYSNCIVGLFHANNTGRIAGGIVGGLLGGVLFAVLIFVVILFLCLQIRKKQVMKVCNGEYYRAWLTYTGYNPRKKM